MDRTVRALYPILVEGSVIFIILVVLLLFEFNSRNLLLPGSQLDKAILNEIFSRSFTISFFFAVTYRLAKSGVFMLSGLVTRYLTTGPQNPLSLQDLLFDIYITLTFILVTVPVRPILQKVYSQEGVVTFENALVKFDAVPAMFTLALVGGLLLFVLFITYREIPRFIYLVGLILSIAIVGVITNKPNFDARVYESRADWVTGDWEKQGLDAQKALADAKTDQEKATAYYWLGVSQNRQSKFAAAKEYLSKAITLDPKYGPAHASLSTSYRLLGNLDLAKLHADKCVEFSPRYAWCYYSLAAYYDALGDKKSAFVNLEKAYTLDPNAVDIKNAYLQYKTLL
jgi:tetratricopeptide (TPR) repeat protein